MKQSAAPVVIVPYDPDWPRQFERERVVLSRIFCSKNVIIEHVGSTAVPNLDAKPIIDIMLGVSALCEVEAEIPELESRGYEYVPEYERQLPERRYFRRPRFGSRTHHLHAVVCGGSFWRRHLAFRDYLRDHPEAATAYRDLKRRLALRHRTDRLAYTEGKSAFVEALLEKAATHGNA